MAFFSEDFNNHNLIWTGSSDWWMVVVRGGDWPDRAVGGVSGVLKLKPMPPLTVADLHSLQCLCRKYQPKETIQNGANY